MIKFSPYITIYNFEASKDIQNEVIWVFSKNLKGISSVRHRFNIHIVESRAAERINIVGSIKTVCKYYSMETFLQASEYEQKVLLLTLITDCFLELSESLNWDSNAIILAKQFSMNEEIRFHYLSKPIWNKTKKMSASIELTLSKNKLSIWVIFLSISKNEIIKKHLLDSSSQQVAIFRFFQRPKWIDSTNFGFEIKNGMNISMSPGDPQGIWHLSGDRKDEWIQKIIIYDENTTPQDLAKLANW